MAQRQINNASPGRVLGSIQLARTGLKDCPKPLPRQWILVEMKVEAEEGPDSWTEGQREEAVTWARRAYLEDPALPPPAHVRAYFDRFDVKLAEPETQAALARGFW